MTKKLFFISFILLLPASVYAEVPAFLREFETQGNIDILYSSFHRLALIFSDGRFKALFFSVLVGSFLFGSLSALSKAFAMSFKFEELMAVFFTFIFCGILYVAIISPTTDIVIRDATTTEFVAVADVPDIVVLLAGLFNSIEQGMVDIIETTATPDSFKDMPNGSMFELFSVMFDGHVNLAGTDTHGEGGKEILDTYIKNCLTFELGRRASTLTIDEIKINTDFRPILAKAASPSIISGMYANDGTIMMCDDAWTRVDGYLNTLSATHPAVNRFMEESCSKIGWLKNIPGVNGTPRLTSCADKAMTHIGNNYAGIAITQNQLFRQKLIANRLHEFTQSGNTVSYGNTQVGNKMMGAGLLAQEWVPKIKGMMYGIFICMMPVMILLLVSPVWKQVFTFIIGGLVFFTMWTICDAMLHSLAMDTALGVMAEIKTNQLGMRSMMHFSSESMKAYAVFGQYKIWAMVLASFFSGGIVKGGSQLGRFGVSQAQDFRSAGQSAAETMNNPAKNAQAMNSLAGASPTQAWHNKAGYSGMSEIAGHQQGVKNQTALKEIGMLGEDGRAAGAISEAKATQSSGAVTRTNSLKKEAKASGFSTVGELQQSMSDAEIQKSSGDAKGFQRGYQAAVKNDGFTGSQSDYKADMTMMSGIENFQSSQAKQAVADARWGGNASNMLKHMNEFKTAKEASTVKHLGGNHMAVGNNVGKNDAAQAEGISDYIKTIGQDGARIDASSQKFKSASGALWRSVIGSVLNGDNQPSPEVGKAIGNILKNRGANAVFSSVGAEGTPVFVDKGQGENLGSMLNYSTERSQKLEGSSALLKMGFGKDGSLNLSHLDAKKGSSQLSENSVRKIDQDTKESNFGIKHDGSLLQSAVGNVGYYAQQLVGAYNRGGGALEKELIAQSGSLGKQAADFLEHRGIKSGETNGSTSVGFSLFGGKLGGSGGLSKRNVETEGVNLHIGKAREYITSALMDAKNQDGGISEANLEKGLKKHLTPWAQDIYKSANEANEYQYGKTALLGSMEESRQENTTIEMSDVSEEETAERYSRRFSE